MSVTVSVTQEDIFAALRTVLLTLVPAFTTTDAGAQAPVEVIEAQANRVAEPDGADFVIMTVTGRTRLATNSDAYTDAYPAVANGLRSITEPTQVAIQLDIHGPQGGEVAQIVMTVFRDGYGVDAFQAANPSIVPLYADDPKQMPFINAEQQYEDRWVVTAALQVNPAVNVFQDFASTLTVGVKAVEVYYP